MHAPNLAHDGDDLVALLFEGLEVVAIDLDGEFALDAADSLFDVVGDGLGEVPDDAGDLIQLALHGGNQLVLILLEDGAPLDLWA